MPKPLIDSALRDKTLALLHQRYAGSLRDESFELDVRKEGDEAVVRRFEWTSPGPR